MTFEQLPYWVPPHGLAPYACWHGWDIADPPSRIPHWVNWLHCIDDKGQGHTAHVTIEHEDVRRNTDEQLLALLAAKKESAEAWMVDRIATFVPNPNIKPYDKSEFFYTKNFIRKKDREKAREAAREATR